MNSTPTASLSVPYRPRDLATKNRISKKYNIRLLLVFAAILLTRPVCTTLGIGQITLAYWMLSIPVFYMLFAKEALALLSRGPGIASLFIAYLGAHCFYDSIINGTSAATTITKNGLLISSLLMFVILKDNRAFIDNPKLFYKTIERLTIFLCLYGFYQAIAFKYGLPVLDAGLIRGRQSGFLPQVCGLFEEPAFFAQYLVVALYVLLNGPKIRIPVIALILASILISRSVGGLLGAVAILSTNLLWSKFHSNETKSRSGTIIAMLILVVLAGFASIQLGVMDYMLSRLDKEVFQHLDIIGTNQYVSGSGGGRVINEINMLLYTLNTRPIMGMGVDTVSFGRLMGLNAVTETVFRYGIIGFFLLTAVILESRFRKKQTPDSWKYWLFLAIFASVDGAISKPIFWILLCIVNISEMIRSKSTVKGNKIFLN